MNLDIIERTQQIRDAAADPNRTIKQRVADAAASLSLVGENQKRVEWLNESVLAMTKLCYEVDADGVPCHIDRLTYRLLIAAPWGRGGWKRWKLRAWESAILGQILRVRCQMQRVPPVFDYNDETGKWYLNYGQYQRFDQALLYWKSNPISLKEWRLHADVYRQNAHDRMNRKRGKE